MMNQKSRISKLWRRCWCLSILLVAHAHGAYGWIPSSFAVCQSATKGQDHRVNVNDSGRRQDAVGLTKKNGSPFQLIDVDLNALRLNLEESPALTIDSELLPNDVQNPRSVVQNVFEDELEAARQVDEIGARIKRLLELQKDRRRQQIERLLQDDSNVSAAIAPRPPDERETGDSDSESSTADTGNEASPNTAEPDDPRHDIETTRILTEPPDQHALADSLYYSGETDLALTLYQNALQTSGRETDDKVWIQYQIASCFRRLQRYDEASTILRQIVEGPETDLVVIHAKWWLDTIEKKHQLASSISTLEQYIERKAGDVSDQ